MQRHDTPQAPSADTLTIPADAVFAIACYGDAGDCRIVTGRDGICAFLREQLPSEYADAIIEVIDDQDREWTSVDDVPFWQFKSSFGDTGEVLIQRVTDVPTTSATPRVMLELRNDAAGCDYEGYDFGAHYPDSTCIEGYLWDLDSCDEPGGGLTKGGEIPCPICNHAKWLEHVEDDVVGDGYEAAANRKSEADCPFPAKARFPQDGEAFRSWWLRGFQECAEENTRPSQEPQQ